MAGFSLGPLFEPLSCLPYPSLSIQNCVSVSLESALINSLLRQNVDLNYNVCILCHTRVIHKYSPGVYP